MQCGRCPNEPFVIATGPTRISIPYSRPPLQATDAAPAHGVRAVRIGVRVPPWPVLSSNGKLEPDPRSKYGFRSQYEIGQAAPTPSRVRTSKSDGWNRGVYPAKCVIDPPTPWPELFFPSSTGSLPPMMRLSVQYSACEPASALTHARSVSQNGPFSKTANCQPARACRCARTRPPAPAPT